MAKVARAACVAHQRVDQVVVCQAVVDQAVVELAVVELAVASRNRPTS